MSAVLAARLGDAVGGHASWWSALVSALATAAAVIAVGALCVAAAASGVGLVAVAGWGLMGVSVACKYGVHVYDKEAAKEEEEDDDDASPCAAILFGATRVFVENQPAARITDPVGHQVAMVKEGSASVHVEGKQAARKKDKSSCGGKIIKAAKRTYFGTHEDRVFHEGCPPPVESGFRKALRYTGIGAGYASIAFMLANPAALIWKGGGMGFFEGAPLWGRGLGELAKLGAYQFGIMPAIHRAFPNAEPYLDVALLAWGYKGLLGSGGAAPPTSEPPPEVAPEPTNGETRPVTNDVPEAPPGGATDPMPTAKADGTKGPYERLVIGPDYDGETGVRIIDHPDMEAEGDLDRFPLPPKGVVERTGHGPGNAERIASDAVKHGGDDLEQITNAGCHGAQNIGEIGSKASDLAGRPIEVEGPTDTIPNPGGGINGGTRRVNNGGSWKRVRVDPATKDFYDDPATRGQIDEPEEAPSGSGEDKADDTECPTCKGSADGDEPDGAIHEVGRSRIGVAPNEGGPETREQLIDELARNGVKHSAKDIVRIGRNAKGDIIFLETGNSRAGLTHILEAHGAEFEAAGIPREKVPDLVMKAVTEGKQVGVQGRAHGRPIYEVEYEGTMRRVAVSTGSNGFVVGANLQSSK